MKPAAGDFFLYFADFSYTPLVTFISDNYLKLLMHRRQQGQRSSAYFNAAERSTDADSA